MRFSAWQMYHNREIEHKDTEEIIDWQFTI